MLRQLAFINASPSLHTPSTALSHFLCNAYYLTSTHLYIFILSLLQCKPLGGMGGLWVIRDTKGIAMNERSRQPVNTCVMNESESTHFFPPQMKSNPRSDSCCVWTLLVWSLQPPAQTKYCKGQLNNASHQVNKLKADSSAQGTAAKFLR